MGTLACVCLGSYKILTCSQKSKMRKVLTLITKCSSEYFGLKNGHASRSCAVASNGKRRLTLHSSIHHNWFFRRRWTFTGNYFRGWNLPEFRLFLDPAELWSYDWQQWCYDDCSKYNAKCSRYFTCCNKENLNIRSRSECITVNSVNSIALKRTVGP